MNGLALTLALLTASEPELCFFRAPVLDFEVDRQPHLPRASDLYRFPDQFVAKSQYDRCHEWREYTRKLRRINGYGDGTRDRQIAELTAAREYWSYLWACHEFDGSRRELLASFRAKIGRDAYDAGWRPGLLECAPPVLLPPPPIERKMLGTGAQ